MPELPEAETIACKLSEKISGKAAENIVIFRKDILRVGALPDFKNLNGKKVLKVSRRAKYIILFFEQEYQLWFHLGMTGQLIWAAGAAQAHVHAQISFQEMPETLSFRDIRRFGGLSLFGPGIKALKGLPVLGPEPLEMPLEDFRQILKGRGSRIKTLLLGQKNIAGIGNIYADEILFRAKIHPKKQAGRISPAKVLDLFQSVQKVLREAVSDGGSSIDDYIHPDGGRGKFQKKHRVYARQGKPCFDCGSDIRRIVLNGRSTCFCPVCQK